MVPSALPLAIRLAALGGTGVAVGVGVAAIGAGVATGAVVGPLATELGEGVADAPPP